MKTKRVLFNTNFYELGAVKYAAGSHYPVTDETDQRILAGDAELIDIDMDKQEAVIEQAAAETRLAEERAATLAAEAEAAGQSGMSVETAAA